MTRLDSADCFYFEQQMKMYDEYGMLLHVKEKSLFVFLFFHEIAGNKTLMLL